MANSMYFDGTDLSVSTYSVTVLDASMMPVAPTPRVESQALPYSFGAASSCNAFDPLEIRATVVVAGTSASNLNSCLDELKYLTDPRNGEKSLRFDDLLSDRYWMCRRITPIAGPSIADRTLQFEMAFLASDSRAYSTSSRTSPDFTISATPHSMTVESGPTVVTGYAVTNPTWIIKNTSGAAVTSLTLNNSTLGESITWSGSLPNTSGWLRITTGAGGKVEKSTNSGGSYADDNSNVTGHGFPRLKPKVANTVILTGLSAGTVVLTYTPRYL